MTASPSSSTATQRNTVDYLKSVRFLQGDLDVAVKSQSRSGMLHVRQGQVLGAQCGKLQGNGALLTLAAIGPADIHSVQSVGPVEKNVSVTVSQIERFFARLPGLAQAESQCDEDRTFAHALQLFFQFRRKEAGAKLVEVLRSNRFYYPAWLWHSRLMTQENTIKKALNEARQWGNSDLSVQREAKKIATQLTGSTEPVKRCIFCWSLLQAGEERCFSCGGFQRISKNSGDREQTSTDLLEILPLYDAEFKKNPRNVRIAYCLCLGFYSLGNLDRASELITQALQIAPREPLFIRTSALLQPVAPEVRQQAAAAMVVPQRTAPGKEATVPTAAAVDNKPKCSDRTVLVVEDSKTARRVITSVLDRKGYRIIEAASGTEALLAIEGMVPDLVLLDVMLPDMTGYDILAVMRKNGRFSDVPVVMLTGKSGAADRQKGISGGSNEYLTKPFEPAKLLAVLARYLESSVQHPPSRPPLPALEKAETVVEPAVVQPAVTRPPAAPPAAMVAPTAAEPTGGMPRENELKKTVLIVEDSPTSRKVIAMVLSRKGYLVQEAVNGQQALRMIEEARPHLILLDAMLPDMTGYDILARLQQDLGLKEIPVVMLTAKDSPMDREKGIRAGSSAYLTKPFNPEKLLSVIGSYI
ncbi:response regulator [Desulfopila sp. IMCC35006]|uniref:response regulator n=1 Tax=Desulfopila sp. IMCC35006 TaxID=2569542 RepID=UPI0010AB6268|nr:response regulator [Desulfopila sp. IMCC35006]TKB25060.1 response regulator [Desulfopila sp. IMCC35006]